MWESNWLWGAPLIVLTGVLHVACLGFFLSRLERALAGRTWRGRGQFAWTFAAAMGLALALVTVLHGLEAVLWAFAYRRIGALPDAHDAVLYSLNAMTSYGHVALYLDPQWALLGALEALNGMILFGLSTAFLFAMIHRVWPALGHKE